MGSNHSVTIQGNEWYDHAAEKDGGPLPQICAPNEKVKRPFELPPANGDNRRMFAYLVKHRRLDRNVVAQFIR